MKRTITLIALSFLLCSAIWAQVTSEYRTGRLTMVGYVPMPLEVGGTRYLIGVREGSYQYIALNKATDSAHDYIKELRTGTEVSYRISGKSLFVKTTGGHEVEAHLCKSVGQISDCDSPDL